MADRHVSGGVFPRGYPLRHGCAGVSFLSSRPRRTCPPAVWAWRWSTHRTAGDHVRARPVPDAGDAKGQHQDRGGSRDLRVEGRDRLFKGPRCVASLARPSGLSPRIGNPGAGPDPWALFCSRHPWNTTSRLGPLGRRPSSEHRGRNSRFRAHELSQEMGILPSDWLHPGGRIWRDPDFSMNYGRLPSVRWFGTPVAPWAVPRQDRRVRP